MVKKDILTFLKELAKDATKTTEVTGECIRHVEKYGEHKDKTVKAFYQTFCCADTDSCVDISGATVENIDGWPTYKPNGSKLGFQLRKPAEVEEWRVFYGQCGKCGKPIYGKWHTIEPLEFGNTTEEEKDSKLAELAKEVIYSPPKCQNCQLCPLKAGQDTPTPCPQKREESGCQWWLTEEQRCAVEVIALRDIAGK